MYNILSYLGTLDKDIHEKNSKQMTGISFRDL